MFDPARLSDPGYFRENRLDAHSDHAFYASAAEREAGSSSLRVSLNGLWKFFCADSGTQVIPGFEQPETDCRAWRDIRVPAHIQLEGYGRPQYCNVQYPWNAEEGLMPGDLPERSNPVACYVKYFFLPETFRGKRVFISFQGVESCVALWLNGQYIGFSSDSFTPHEFELTGALTEGENKLACRVYRYCSGSWLEDQDFLRFSGIFREVFLYAVPKAHLWDMHTVAEPDAAFRGGTLRLTARTEAPEGSTLTARLKDGDAVLCEKAVPAGIGEAALTFAVETVRLWSAEDPYLYTLDIGLAAPDGETEYIRERVGFRRIEIRNSLILLNGVRLVFKGVNRHDFCGETGRAVPAEKIRRDLLVMKRNNINAVRTSHYPNTSALYRLCDELGLYVIDENNMESHGMWDLYWRKKTDRMFPGEYPEWQDLLVDRVRSTATRDRNHPSVIIWSCGNESLTGPVILEMSREFRRLDPTRPVHYEGDHQVPWDRRFREITDIETEMYTPAARVREYLKEHRDKPFILCEYTHSMGNSNGGMHKYTELAWEEPLYHGGFIWDFVDQALLTRDRDGKERLLYGGDWDDRPTDGIFCGNGIVFADGRETPKLQEIRYNYRDIDVRVAEDGIRIFNRHMFTSTAAYRCVMKLERDGKEIARREVPTDIAPRAEGFLADPFGKQEVPGEYALTVSFLTREDTEWAKAGWEVAFGQGIRTVVGEKQTAEHAPLRVTDGAWNIGITGEDFSVIFSRGDGALVSYRRGDTELIREPLKPNFWRAPTNNDMGNRMPQRYAQWKIASEYIASGLTRETGEKNGAVRPLENPDGSVSFTWTYDLPTSPAATCSLTYTVFPCGTVKGLLRYEPVAELKDPPEFGMIMKLKADFSRVRYYGLGPDENYIDRREGARLGIFAYRAEENLTPYLMPQECGNRTGVRWAEITDASGKGLKLFLNGGEFSALPYTPHELENAAHGYELPPAEYTVLKMSARQMGVAGDDSWGARTHEEYLLDISRPLEFAFAFRGMN